MGNCDHDRITYRAATKRLDGTPIAVLSAHCADCGVRFRFRGAKNGYSTTAPGADRQRLEIRLPLEPIAPAAGGRLRCDACRVPLFGQPLDEAPPLSRPVRIDRIDCGPIHRVHYADGIRLCVADGRVWPDDGTIWKDEGGNDGDESSAAATPGQDAAARSGPDNGATPSG